MSDTVKIGDRLVGNGHPAFIVAEIGINHNGDLNIAKSLIDVAAVAGCDAVKFQKRTPELCVPAEYRDVKRETPWGIMTYLDYRYRVEFGQKEYAEIAAYCRTKGVTWFASCWDIPSVDFMEQFAPACYKVASASMTDDALLQHTRAMNRPVIMSTGMSTIEEIRHAFSLMDKNQLIMTHTTSTYPCKPQELNLRIHSKPAGGIWRAGRLFWPRSRTADHLCGGGVRGLSRRAAHYSRSRDVGHRSSGVGRAFRADPPRPRYSRDRAGDGRWTEAHVRQRTCGARKTAEEVKVARPIYQSRLSLEPCRLMPSDE